MISDKSKDFNETWQFLDRRLKDVHSVGNFVNNNKTYMNSVITGFSSIASILSPKNLNMDDTIIR